MKIRNCFLISFIAFFSFTLQAQIIVNPNPGGVFIPGNNLPNSPAVKMLSSHSIADVSYNHDKRRLVVSKTSGHHAFLNNGQLVNEPGNPIAASLAEDEISTALFVRSANNDLFLREFYGSNLQYIRWLDQHLKVTDLSAAPNSSVFVAVQSGCIRRIDVHNDEQHFSSCLDLGWNFKKIAAKDNATIWAVNHNNEVVVSEDRGGNVITKTGLYGKDIAIDHYNNRIYAIDMNGNVVEYRTNENILFGSPEWVKVPQAPQNAQRITAGHGKIWIVTNQGQLYEYTQPLTIRS